MRKSVVRGCLQAPALQLPSQPVSAGERRCNLCLFAPNTQIRCWVSSTANYATTPNYAFTHVWYVWLCFSAAFCDHWCTSHREHDTAYGGIAQGEWPNCTLIPEAAGAQACNVGLLLDTWEFFSYKLLMCDSCCF